MGISSISSTYASTTSYSYSAVEKRPAKAEEPATTETEAGGVDAAKKSQASANGKTELTAEQLAQIAKLKARDQQVRQHEMAHLAASGGLAKSGANYTYQKGPDGVSYAIGGEVSIDTSPGRTPEDTIQRARTIQAAALAPSDPSAPDRAVAAAAQQMEMQARSELALKNVQDNAQKAKKSSEEPVEEAGKSSSPVQATGESSLAKTQDKTSQVASTYAVTMNQIAGQVNTFA